MNKFLFLFTIILITCTCNGFNVSNYRYLKVAGRSSRGHSSGGHSSGGHSSGGHSSSKSRPTSEHGSNSKPTSRVRFDTQMNERTLGTYSSYPETITNYKSLYKSNEEYSSRFHSIYLAFWLIHSNQIRYYYIGTDDGTIDNSYLCLEYDNSTINATDLYKNETWNNIQLNLLEWSSLNNTDVNNTFLTEEYSNETYNTVTMDKEIYANGYYNGTPSFNDTYCEYVFNSAFKTGVSILSLLLLAIVTFLTVVKV